MEKGKIAGTLIGWGLLIIMFALFCLKSTKDYSDERDKILENYQIVVGSALEYTPIF